MTCPQEDMNNPSGDIYSRLDHSGRSKVYRRVHNAHYNKWFDSWFDNTEEVPPDECGWDAHDDDNEDWEIAEKEGLLYEDDVMWELIHRWGG